MILNNCIAAFTGLVIGTPIDKTREIIYYKKNCDINEIKEKFLSDKESYGKTIYKNTIFIDLILSFSGMFAFYPNGLKMFGSFIYTFLVTFISSHSDRYEDNEKFNWLNVENPNLCGNYKNFVKIQETIQIELDKNKNNSQLTPNTSKEILKEICFEKSIPFDNSLHQKIISIYTSHYKEEKTKFKLKKNKNPKLDFKKYIINAEWDSVYADNTNYLNCELEYFIHYEGGDGKFIEDHFVIEKSN